MAKRTKRSYRHYGLTVYEFYDGTVWVVGDDGDKSRDARGRTRVDRAARRVVINDLWAFRTEFIAAFLTSRVKHFARTRESDIIAMLKPAQEKLCEDAGPIVRALLGRSLSKFVDEALRADGRGRFLSSYDGEERDSDDVPGLPRGKVAFRLN